MLKARLIDLALAAKSPGEIIRRGNGNWAKRAQFKRAPSVSASRRTHWRRRKPQATALATSAILGAICNFATSAPSAVGARHFAVLCYSTLRAPARFCATTLVSSNVGAARANS